MLRFLRRTFSRRDRNRPQQNVKPVRPASQEKGFTTTIEIIGAIIVSHYYLKMGILDTENRDMDIRKINANQTKAYSSSPQM